LAAARYAAAEGRHEFALAEYVWFHDHALEETPSLYGVRLSFALRDWKELAEVYPPAREALLAIRNQKTRALLSGEGDQALFHDVAAINRQFDAHADTTSVFRQLDTQYPALAKECAPIARESLASAGDYELAAKYLPPEPLKHVRQLAERLNADVAEIPQRPRSKSPRYLVHTHCYANEVRTIEEILAGSGQQALAQAFRATAIENLRTWYVRRAVTNILDNRESHPHG
jgi:hypothetical protein